MHFRATWTGWSRRQQLRALSAGACLWLFGLLTGRGDGLGATEGFAPFQIIAEHNIFSAHPAPQPTPLEPTKSAVNERLALVGTMSYEKGVFAFFEASQPEFHKALRVGEIVAGCTVLEITFRDVKLQCGEATIVLPVGECLRRETAGVWELGGALEDSDSDSERTTPRTTSPTLASSNPEPSKEQTAANDFEKTNRRAEKKYGKYFTEGSNDPRKASKQWSKMANGFSDEAARRSKKPRKN